MEEDEQKKPKLRKEQSKKSNVQPALLAGVNTNVFSQLSANYLQTKQNISEEERSFVQNTEIIEYHDPNINRLIGLLRKKAEATKSKAMNELKEAVKAMDAQQVELFTPTFSYLFREMVLNEQSRQIIEEMCGLLAHLIEKHKKIVVGSIAVLYPAMLIAQRLSNSKFVQLLFSEPATQTQKSVLLLLKPEVAKQFNIISSIVLDNEDAAKLSTPVYQRNCHALLKAWKDMVTAFWSLPEESRTKIEQPWSVQYDKFIVLLNSEGASRYLKEDTRAKAALLEVFVQVLSVYVEKGKPSELRIQYFVSTLLNNFTSKDLIVQTTLWKYCNTPLLIILPKLKQDQLVKGLEIRLLDMLKQGGVPMLKELPNWLKHLPAVSLAGSDMNGLLNTINYFRKLNDLILDLDEQNQARLQCYSQLNLYLIGEYHRLRSELPSNTPDDKENKRRDELRRLTEKAEKEAASNLQERYYRHPPTSRNSLSFYIPQYFVELVKAMDILPSMRFCPPHTYTLYRQLATIERFQPLVDSIFESRKTSQELLEYFENFPARAVQIEMKGGDLQEIYTRCRIVHYTLDYQQLKWFEWDHHYNLFMFDPLLEPHHIQLMAERGCPQFNQKLFPAALLSRNLEERLSYIVKLFREKDGKLRFFLFSLVELLKRIPNIDWQPFYEIYRRDMKELASNVPAIRNMECMYNVLLGYLSSSPNTTSDFLDEFFRAYCQLPFQAEAAKLNDLAAELFDKAKELKDHVNFKWVLESIKEQVCLRAGALIQAGVNTEEKRERMLRNRLVAALALFRKCSDFLLFVRHRATLSDICRELLQPGMLKYALFRAEVWVILKDFLQLLTDEQVRKLLEEQLVKGNFGCLRLLMSLAYLFPLQSDLSLKRYFVQLSSTVVKPYLLDLLQDQNQMVIELMETLTTRSYEESLIFSVGLRAFVKQAILECGSNEVESLIFETCVVRLFQRLNKESDGERLMRMSITLSNILPQFGHLLKQRTEIFEQAAAVVRQILATKKLEEGYSRLLFEANIQVLSIYWAQGILTELMFQPQKFPLQVLINDWMDILAGEFLNINYEMQVLLTFANVVIEKKTLEPFSDHLVKLQNMIMKLMNVNYRAASHQEDSKYSSESLIRLCQFLRKIIPVFEAFRPEFKELVVQHILDLCLAKVEEYRLLAEDIHDGVIDENVDNVIGEFSELISRLALIVFPEADEELMAGLLGCVFPQIQKSSFVLLRQYYELGYAKGEASPAFITRLQTGIDPEGTAMVFSQLLSWSAFFLRKLSTDKQRKEDSEQQSAQELIDSRKLSERYLQFAFSVFEHLEFEEGDKDFELEPSEVWEIAPNWSNYLSKKELLRLAVQSLFIFADSFPMTLRLWVGSQKDKTKRSLCEAVVTKLISEALFLKEVEKIELRQAEWKSQDFEIYASKRSREISAQYRKEGASVGLKLKIKPDYPLSPIVIDFDNELKISQQLNKWAIRLRSLLYNQNNSVVSAILLWKQNIDKQFQGLEQCAICYDIVNQAKQLPRMVCRTCKKKFHSACIRKWFTTSNKSECPLCKSQFL